MPRVSIVIPVYNYEGIINNLENVCQQTLQDIEIICVDDGSTDRTADVIKEFAVQDERVHLIKQSNNGAFSARYNGAQKATGEYIMFLDQDDSLLSDAAEKLLKVAEAKQADIVEYGVELVVDEQRMNSDQEYRSSYGFYSDYFSYKHPIPENLESGELINLCFDKRQITWNIWNKFCKTDLVRQAWRYYEGECIGIEDMLESLMLFCVAHHYVHYDAKLYCFKMDCGLSKAGMITNSKQTKYFGSAAILFRLQREWMDKLDIKPKKCEAGIAAFRKRVREDIFSVLFHRCDAERREEMLGWIQQCISQEEFDREIIKYAFDYYGSQAQEIRELRKEVEKLRKELREDEKRYLYYPLGKELSFAEKSETDRYIVEGMYEPECWGRWSKENEMVLQFYFVENVGADLIVHMAYSVMNSNQRVVVYANDQKINSYEEKDEFVKHDIRISKDLVTKNLLKLKFELPDAVCPYDKNGYGDERTLAIGLSKMSIDVCDKE